MPERRNAARTRSGATVSPPASRHRKHSTARGMGQPWARDRRFRERARRLDGLGPRAVGEVLLELAAGVPALAPAILAGLGRHTPPEPALVAAAGGRDRPGPADLLRVAAGHRP